MLDFKRRIRSGKPRLKKTPAYRRELLQQFEKSWLAGASRSEAAADIGVSIATVDRWRREIAKSDKQKTASSDFIPIDIDATIACLASQTPPSPLQKLEALIAFMVWMRWPKEPASHHIAISACLAAYFVQKSSARTVDQLPPDERRLVQKYLILKDIRDAFSLESTSVVYFDLFEFEGSSYHDYDLAAIVVKLILTGSPNTRGKVSLTDTFNIIAERSKIKTKFFSQRGLFNFWPAVSVAAPFCYVNQFHFDDHSFLEDPYDASFSIKIDKMLLAESELRTFFAQSLWVVNSLTKLLDRRALQSIYFPRFPSDLSPEEASPFHTDV